MQNDNEIMSFWAMGTHFVTKTMIWDFLSWTELNELNEMKNLQKKIDYYKDILGNNDDKGAVTTEEDESDEEEEEIQPKKKNIKKQRQGVSAEVYGEFNKKENFVPKVI